MSTTPGSGAMTEYDAFLSYSHAADGRLAPALQNAVQRFATPWYRLRSLRLFRDQTGLSASPALWASIEVALERAAWFVLFASPDAADSVWVGREVSWWLRHRDHGRMLIVVTDGTFEWDGARGRAGGSAIPVVLATVFPEEPRWIDMRWARGADQVDPRDPRFREAAADLAATLRGMPKDLLIGDDVRQYRRGRRLATAALAILTVLAIAVTALVVVATRQQATTAGALAARSAGSMIVEADALRSRDPRIALQLGVAAHQLDPTPVTEADLLQSLTTPFLAELAGHESAITAVAWSPDGTRFASADGRGRMIVHELTGPDTASPVGPPVELGAAVQQLAFTTGGDQLAVATAGRAEIVEIPGLRTAASTPVPGTSDLLAATPSGELVIVADDRLLRWSRDAAVSSETLAGAGVVTGSALSPDGRLLATASPSAGIVLWDVTGPPQRLGVVTPTVTTTTLLRFGPGGASLVVGIEDGTVTSWDIRDPRAPVVLSSSVAVERTLAGLDVSDDGTLQATASIDGSVTLRARAETLQLRAHRTVPRVIAFAPDGARLLSGSLDGALVLWNTTPARGAALATLDPTGHAGALLTTAVAGTPGGPLAAGGNNGVLLWDVPEPGRLVRRPARLDVAGPVLSLAFGSDDRMLAVGTRTGRVELWDLTDPGGPRMLRSVAVPGSDVFDLEFFPDGRTLVAVGESVGVQLVDVATGAVTGLPDAGRPRAVVLTPDGGRLVVADTFTNMFVVWDVADRARPAVATRVSNGHETVTVEAMTLTSDGILVSAGRDGKLVLSAFGAPDRPQRLGEIDTATRVQTRDDAAALLAVSVSRDGRLLAAAGEEGPVRLWDIADPSRPRPLGAPLVELAGQVYGVAILDDGLTLVAVGEDERIAAWDMRPIDDLRRTVVEAAPSLPRSPETA